MLEIHREVSEDEMLSVVCFKRLQGKKGTEETGVAKC